MSRVPDVKCAGDCGKLLWSGKTSLPEGKAMCRACRAKTITHGTSKGYKRGCRCEECTGWNRLSHSDYRRQRMAGEFALKECTHDGCDKPSASRTLCTMHYKRWARANGMEQSPSNKWSDTRRSNYHARRARMNGGSTGDRVLQAELLLRDGPTCTGCQGHIDVDISYPDPHSPSVDHTIPISKGGDHSMDNCTIMHLRCNLMKGARLIEA